MWVEDCLGASRMVQCGSGLTFPKTWVLKGGVGEGAWDAKNR